MDGVSNSVFRNQGKEKKRKEISSWSNSYIFKILKSRVSRDTCVHSKCSAVRVMVSYISNPLMILSSFTVHYITFHISEKSNTLPSSSGFIIDEKINDMLIHFLILVYQLHPMDLAYRHPSMQ